MHSSKRLRVIVRKCATVVIITVSTILLFEFSYRAILRLAPGLLTAAKSRGLDYGDTWRSEGFGPGGSLKENFDAMVLGPYGNTVHWKNNAQGFRNDYDVTQEPGPGVVRVMSVGDSFTAGYRLAQDETFSYLLERYLNTKSDGSKYEVLISAVDDPSAALHYLNSSGLSFKPKLVLLGVTLGNDIAESYVALAPDGRFKLNDETGRIEVNTSRTLGFSRGLEKMLIPAGCAGVTQSFLDRRSITFHLMKRLWRSRQNGEAIVSWYDRQDLRLFDPVNGLGNYLKEPPREGQEAYERLFRTLRALKKVSAREGASFAVVVFPQRFQMQKEDWALTIEDYGLNEACFDLNLPNRLLADFCAQNDIVCIDPAPAIAAAHNTSSRNLYCPQGDMHLNAEGNRVLFEAIKDEVYRELRKAVAH